MQSILWYIKKRKNGLNLQTPVICLTADALNGAKICYMTEGFDDYLSKPIDSRKLKQIIMQHLLLREFITEAPKKEKTCKVL